MIADRTVLGLDSQPIKFLLIQFRRVQNEPVPCLQRSRRERHHIEQSGGEFIAAPRHHRFANQVRQNPLPEARLLQQIDRRSGANEIVVAGDDDTYVGKVPAGVVTSPDDDVSPPVQLCR